MYYQVV